MKTKILFVIAALTGGLGVLAIGAAMLVNVVKQSPPAPAAPAAAAVAPPAALPAAPVAAPAPPPPAAATASPATAPAVPNQPPAATSGGPVDIPDYLQPQRPAPMVSQVAAQPPPAAQEPAAAPPPQPAPQPVAPAAYAQPSGFGPTPPPDNGYGGNPGMAPAQPAMQRTYVGGLPSDGSQPAYGEPDPGDMPQPGYAPAPLPVAEADSYQYFYEPLRAQGEWVSVDGYGYCWQPAGVAFGWRPYSEGHWLWTECGWTWASDEPWGWATYHYGRWMPTAECGWVWVPGRVWAPAWVCWRRGPDFVGWAPLPPGAPVGRAVVQEAFGIHVGSWTMVMESDFLAPRCAAVAFPMERCREMLPRATVVINVTQVNNYYVNVGPGHRRIETVYHKPLPTLHLRASGNTHDQPFRIERDVVLVKPALYRQITPEHLGNIKRITGITVVKEQTRIGSVKTPTAFHAVRSFTPAGTSVESERAGRSKNEHFENRFSETTQKLPPSQRIVPTPAGSSENSTALSKHFNQSGWQHQNQPPAVVERPARSERFVAPPAWSAAQPAEQVRKFVPAENRALEYRSRAAEGQSPAHAYTSSESARETERLRVSPEALRRAQQQQQANHGSQTPTQGRGKKEKSDEQKPQ